jgi:hypothetical protein
MRTIQLDVWTDEHMKCALRGGSLPGEHHSPLYRQGLIDALKRIPAEHRQEAFDRALCAIAAEEHSATLRKRVADMPDDELEELLRRAG